MFGRRTEIPDQINIGCGYNKWSGYLNVDSEASCEPDILVVDNDFSRLPQEYFREAFAMDVLEHIPRNQMMGALYDWVGLLKMGGQMTVQTSSVFGIIDVMREKGDFETAHNWKRCLFGNQAHPGDWHYNGFTEATLPVYLRAVGLTPGTIELRDRWLLHVVSTKTEDFKALEEIEDYREFVLEAYKRLLGREPEEGRYAYPPSSRNSPARRQEVRSLACSEERLYWLGS